MKQLAVGLLLILMSLDAVADVVVGIFPRRPATATLKLYTPLMNALSHEFKEKFNLVVPKDFKTFWKGVVEKKYDLVHFNQYHYIRSHKEQGYQVLVANIEHGKKDIAGMLTVRRDSNINDLQDLKGKSIIFGGGRKAMVAYIAPTAILKQAGLVEGKDYQIRFTKNPPSALLGVHNNIVHAAGAGNIALQIMSVTKTMDVNNFKVLATGESFVHLPWAAIGSMPEAKRNRIREFMINLNNSEQGKKILKAARVNGFYRVEDSDFVKVRKITDYVLGEKF